MESVFNDSNSSSTSAATQLDLLQLLKKRNWGSSLRDTSRISPRETLVLCGYGAIVLMSIFGNLLVCQILWRNGRLRSSTYIFIGNLALSDFLMTVLNIPFNLARILLADWPFGSFMCSLVPLVQVTSVYVSTFTMMSIAVDRYRIISEPLRPRIKKAQALKAMASVWLLAILLSLPHAVFNRIETHFSYRRLTRCVAAYPPRLSPWITLFTFLTQYVAPLAITGVVYALIMGRIWSRGALGAVTESQLASQANAKKKTIKMLVLVVLLFALCWLPLNVFNVLREFRYISYKSYKHSTLFFLCHWLAMSSVCYNPFIYCWLNEHFRAGALRCLFCPTRSAGSKLSHLSSIARRTVQKNSASSVTTDLEARAMGTFRVASRDPVHEVGQKEVSV